MTLPPVQLPSASDPGLQAMNRLGRLLAVVGSQPARVLIPEAVEERPRHPRPTYAEVMASIEFREARKRPRAKVLALRPAADPSHDQLDLFGGPGLPDDSLTHTW